MADDLYTTKTAALKATFVDARVIDAKKIKIKGQDILEKIEGASKTTKHANDTRETITKNDLWGQWIETTDDEIIVHDDWVVNPNGSRAWNSSITKVENNKAYTADIDSYGNLSNLALCANIQTEKIKDGSAMFYCSALASFSSDLSSLTNGYYMFVWCSNLTTFSSDLPKLTDGYEMFRGCTKLTSFSSDLSSLTGGKYMFANCYNLDSFSSNLSSLTNGYYMFYNCDNLTSFTSDLSSLTNGDGMFVESSNLISFNSNLSSLMSGIRMFKNCSKLKSFSSDLSSLINGYQMFQGCSNLTSFTSDLSSLTNGDEMFQYCEALASFSSDLSSLTNGDNMFSGCKLDTESLVHIAESINTVTNSPSIYIGIGNATPTEEENELLTEIHEKGWKVFVNGSQFTSSATTMSMRGVRNITELPVLVKKVEVDDDRAKFIDEDGKFYDIEGGNFIYVNDPETYTEFPNMEEAIASLGLTVYVRDEK